MEYKVTENNIHIQDSYVITKRKDMKDILEKLKAEYPECLSFKRTMYSLTSEWKTHNRLYRLGYKKDRTGSVDMNYPLKWYVELAYKIFGMF